MLWDQELLVRPLIVEPTAEIEREDGWSEAKGFLIGGMALHDDLSGQFYAAAQDLVASVKRGEVGDFQVANPVLYLYRHALELQLKVATGAKAKRHDLHALVADLDLTTQARHGQGLPAWMRDRLREIADIDPASTAFRYGETYDRRAGRTVCVPGELYIDLRQLEAVMAALRWAIQELGRQEPFARSGPQVHPEVV